MVIKKKSVKNIVERTQKTAPEPVNGNMQKETKKTAELASDLEFDMPREEFEQAHSIPPRREFHSRDRPPFRHDSRPMGGGRPHDNRFRPRDGPIRGPLDRTRFNSDRPFERPKSLPGELSANGLQGKLTEIPTEKPREFSQPPEVAMIKPAEIPLDVPKVIPLPGASEKENPSVIRPLDRRRPQGRPNDRLPLRGRPSLIPDSKPRGLSYVGPPVIKAQRVGVFVDVQNMYYSAKHLYDSKVNFKIVLEDGVKGRQLIRAIAYGIKADIKEEINFFEALENIGFEVKTKDLQIFVDGSKKGDWDVGLAMDAMRLAPKLDVVVLISGDGDFRDLVEYLKSSGCRVEVMAFKKTTSAMLVEVADSFTDLASRKYLIK